MSRRVYLLGIGLALMALAFAFTDWAVSLQPGVTEANVKRLRTGMPLSEVERILGRPADSEFRAPVLSWPPQPRPYDGYWHGGEGTAWVIFNADRTVRAAVFDRTSPTGGLLSRLRASLGW